MSPTTVARTDAPQVQRVNLATRRALAEMIEAESRELTGLPAEEAFRRIADGTISDPEIVEELEMLRALATS